MKQGNVVWGNEEMRKCGNEEIITSFPAFLISEANSIYIRISYVNPFRGPSRVPPGAVSGSARRPSRVPLGGRL